MTESRRMLVAAALIFTAIGLARSGSWADQVNSLPKTDPIIIQNTKLSISSEDLHTRCVLTQADQEYTRKVACTVDSVDIATTTILLQSKYLKISVAFQKQTWVDPQQGPRNHFMLFEGTTEENIFHTTLTYLNFRSEYVDFTGLQSGVLGNFAVATGHSGMHGFTYYVFRRGDNAWKSFDADSWITDFQAQLPKDWWTLEPLLMNFGSGYALLELHRPTDSEARGTGGMALVQLAVRGDRFVVVKTLLTSGRFN